MKQEVSPRNVFRAVRIQADTTIQLRQVLQEHSCIVFMYCIHVFMYCIHCIHCIMYCKRFLQCVFWKVIFLESNGNCMHFYLLHIIANVVLLYVAFPAKTLAANSLPLTASPCIPSIYLNYIRTNMSKVVLLVIEIGIVGNSCLTWM